MNKLNIYLDPYAFYVRLDEDDFEENKKNNNLQKWIDNRKGALMYEFIQFEIFNENFDLSFPKCVTKLGISGSRLLCSHPFLKNLLLKSIGLDNIVIKTENEFIINFNEKQSNKFEANSKYNTSNLEVWISKIHFSISESKSELLEIVYYSNGKSSSKNYHLISQSFSLRNPDYYFLFDLNN